MRKGKQLLMRMAFLLIALVWLFSPGQAISAGLEPTDSGAPSAIMMFPVTDKPENMGMPPVAFNHLIHEKWAASNKKDCVVCHHTGDPVSCTTCHTVEGKKEGNFVTLYTATHKTNISSKDGNPPASCVSCHAAEVKNRNCAGCHETLVSKNVRKQASWCSVCHMSKPEITKTQFEQGVKNTLLEEENEKLAEKIALERKETKYWSPLSAPYKVSIDTLQDQYEPSMFNHRHHIASLMERIEKNKLAGAFHTQQGTLCVTCHHRSPASQTPPKCVTCHSAKINPDQPGKPNLKAAFHLQCMSCHTDMKVARPRPTDCQTCHKLRTVQGSEN